MTEEIRQLVRSNNEKIRLLKDSKDIKTHNINLKQILDETETNLCVKDDEITELFKKEVIVKTESKDYVIFF